MSSGQGIRVFLSYAHSDQQCARKLSEYLDAAGFQVFDPADELLPGDNWSLEIGRALDTSEAMVVLISPAGVPTKDFPWVLNHLSWIKLEGNLAEAGEQLSKILHASGGPRG